MSKPPAPIHQIELRIATLSELFNSMDPTPFHHCDLDRDAQEYLESWAMSFSHSSHFRIIVHIESMPDTDPSTLVTEAIHNFFNYKAEITKRQVRLLLNEGRTSLGIGLSFLLLCLLGADYLSGPTDNTFLRVLRESLIIGGWVAMWRPLQIFFIRMVANCETGTNFSQSGQSCSARDTRFANVRRHGLANQAAPAKPISCADSPCSSSQSPRHCEQ